MKLLHIINCRGCPCMYLDEADGNEWKCDQEHKIINNPEDILPDCPLEDAPDRLTMRDVGLINYFRLWRKHRRVLLNLRLKNTHIHAWLWGYKIHPAQSGKPAWKLYEFFLWRFNKRIEVVHA